MKIKIAEIKAIYQRINEINRLKFEDITFIDDDGKPVTLTDEQKRVWDNTGLNNVHFVVLEFWDKDLEYFSLREVEQYLRKLEEDPKRSYVEGFGDEKLCDCGHPYYRHFDTYEDMEPVGCKYCHCRTWREPGAPDPHPENCHFCRGTKIAKDYNTQEPIPCRQCDLDARAKEVAEREAYFASQEARRLDSTNS